MLSSNVNRLHRFRGGFSLASHFSISGTELKWTPSTPPAAGHSAKEAKMVKVKDAGTFGHKSHITCKLYFTQILFILLPTGTTLSSERTS